MSNTILKEQWLIAEYIDDKGNYQKVKYRKIESYTFYLRFIGKWFNPCVKCQKELKDMLETFQLCFSQTSMTIEFMQLIEGANNEKMYHAFRFPFVHSTIPYDWRPCKNCQAIITKLLQEASTLIIGNEKYEHPVEFDKKNETDEKSYRTLETHKATKEEKERIGDHWLYEETTK